jgi:hypothetical protein
MVPHRQANDNPSDHDQEQKKGHSDDNEHRRIVASSLLPGILVDSGVPGGAGLPQSSSSDLSALSAFSAVKMYFHL